MPQENMSSSSAHLLYKLLKALSLDTGAAIQQGPLGSSDPKLRFHCFTNTESTELLQFFLPEEEGLTQLRSTSPDAFDQDGKCCDLIPVYEALRKHFVKYWNDCKEWVEGNLAISKAVQAYLRDEGKLPNSKENLYAEYLEDVKYRRTKVKSGDLSDIFTKDPSVRNFMDTYGGGTVVLNEVTKFRLGEKDEIEAIVSITMIWLAQLGESVAGCTSFRNLLYEKIRHLFLEDDPRIPDNPNFGPDFSLDFSEIANVAYHGMLVEQLGLSGSAVKEQTMEDILGKNSPLDYLEYKEKLMYDQPNLADISSDNVKRKTLERNEEM